MIKFVRRYAILLVAGFLALLCFTLMGANAILIYRMNNDLMYIYIWLGGVILLCLGLYHPVKMLITLHKVANESESIIGARYGTGKD